jgi:hypothetical protein
MLSLTDLHGSPTPTFRPEFFRDLTNTGCPGPLTSFRMGLDARMRFALL